MGFYITVEAEVDLEEYQDEINNIMLKTAMQKLYRHTSENLKKNCTFIKKNTGELRSRF